MPIGPAPTIRTGCLAVTPSSSGDAPRRELRIVEIERIPALPCRQVSCAPSVYFLRSRNPCISRCGSPVRKDCPNTPTLRLTDSVSGSSSHCRSSAFCERSASGPHSSSALTVCSTAASSPPCLRDHVDQAPGERGRRVDIFRRHDQPAGAAPADQPRQQRGVDHRGDADTDLRHAEFGVMRGNPEIAGGGDFESAAEAPAGQPRDHGRRKLAHGLAEVAQPRDEGFRGFLVEFRHLLDVGAADHALLALAGEDRPRGCPCRRRASRTPRARRR